MSTARPLLDVVRLLSTDPEAAAQYGADPQGWLAEQGWDDVDGHDVVDAVELGWGSIEPSLADRLAPSAADREVDPSAALAGLVGGSDPDDELDTDERELDDRDDVGELDEPTDRDAGDDTDDELDDHDFGGGHRPSEGAVDQGDEPDDDHRAFGAGSDADEAAEAPSFEQPADPFDSAGPDGAPLLAELDDPFEARPADLEPAVATEEADDDYGSGFDDGDAHDHDDPFDFDDLS